MTQQPEALRLADAMLNYWDERGPDAEAVGAELRRLHGFEVAYGVMMTQAESRIITLEAALRQAVEALNTARLSCVAETTTTAIDEALTAARQALEGSMTDRELMQQALEALTEFDGTNGESKRKRVLAALRERLAQPEQEPTAWRWKERINGDFDSWVVTSSEPPPHAVEQQPLYTVPQPAQQPLTDEQISDLWCKVSNTDFVTMDTHEFARVIERAHGIKEKNT